MKKLSYLLFCLLMGMYTGFVLPNIINPNTHQVLLIVTGFICSIIITRIGYKFFYD